MGRHGPPVAAAVSALRLNDHDAHPNERANALAAEAIALVNPEVNAVVETAAVGGTFRSGRAVGTASSAGDDLGTRLEEAIVTAASPFARVVLLAPYVVVIFFSHLMLGGSAGWGTMHAALLALFAWQFRDAFRPLWSRRDP